MKKIIVTPAGRKRYLEILLKHLEKCRDEFDRWDIWCNTTDIDDIDYMQHLAQAYSWITFVPAKIPVNGCASIYHFFKPYAKKDEIYVRLDDDIVYIKKGSLKSLFNEREHNTKNLLLYGNIINNAVLTHLHQRIGHLSLNAGIVDYECGCSTGWGNPQFAESIHREFLARPEADYSMADWELYYYERVSINVISWRGDTFNKFNGDVGHDEEHWLSCEQPKLMKMPNKIIGDTLFVHYSFYTQREYLDSTDILSSYKELSQRTTPV